MRHLADFGWYSKLTSATWCRQFSFWQRQTIKDITECTHTHSKINVKYSTYCLQARRKHSPQYVISHDCRNPLSSPAFVLSWRWHLRICGESALSTFLPKTDLYIYSIVAASSVNSHCCTGFCQWIVCLGCARIIQYWAAHRELSRSSWRGCVGWKRLPLLVASGRTGNQFKDSPYNSD